MERKPIKLELQPVVILYKNYKGRTTYRNILPIELWYGTTKYHREPGWLLTANDLDEAELRDFSMEGILEWNVDMKEKIKMKADQLQKLEPGSQHQYGDITFDGKEWYRPLINLSSVHFTQ
jgi:predicted DNA-binding transcriptional regulator YafY